IAQIIQYHFTGYPPRDSSKPADRRRARRPTTDPRASAHRRGRETMLTGRGEGLLVPHPSAARSRRRGKGRSVSGWWADASPTDAWQHGFTASSPDNTRGTSMTTILRSLLKGATLGALAFSLATGSAFAGHGSSGGGRLFGGGSSGGGKHH